MVLNRFTRGFIQRNVNAASIHARVPTRTLPVYTRAPIQIVSLPVRRKSESEKEGLPIGSYRLRVHLSKVNIGVFTSDYKNAARRTKEATSVRDVPKLIPQTRYLSGISREISSIDNVSAQSVAISEISRKVWIGEEGMTYKIIEYPCTISGCSQNKIKIPVHPIGKLYPAT